MWVQHKKVRAASNIPDPSYRLRALGTMQVVEITVLARNQRLSLAVLPLGQFRVHRALIFGHQRSREVWMGMLTAISPVRSMRSVCPLDCPVRVLKVSSPPSFLRHRNKVRPQWRFLCSPGIALQLPFSWPTCSISNNRRGNRHRTKDLDSYFALYLNKLLCDLRQPIQCLGLFSAAKW